MQISSVVSEFCDWKHSWKSREAQKMSACKVLSAQCLLLGVCLLALVAAQVPITPRECPANETFLACGPSCQTECATLNQPCLINHIRCPDGCYCNKGFARDSAGTCIPIAQCSRRGSYSN